MTISRDFIGSSPKTLPVTRQSGEQPVRCVWHHFRHIGRNVMIPNIHADNKSICVYEDLSIGLLAVRPVSVTVSVAVSVAATDSMWPTEWLIGDPQGSTKPRIHGVPLSSPNG